MKVAKHKGTGLWVVRLPAKFTGTGKRQSKYFQSRSKADQFARQFRTERAEHGRSQVTAEERAWINVARDKLGDLGKLGEVLQHWSKTGENIKAITAQDAATQFIQYKEAENLNDGTLDDIQSRLREFGRRFGDARLNEISPSNLDIYLRTKRGWNRRSFWKRLYSFYKYALLQEWVSENPLNKLIPPPIPEANREIYTPEQYSRLLAAAKQENDEVLRYLVLMGTGFLRTQELVQRFANEDVMVWRDIRRIRGIMHVRREVAKATKREGGNERYIEICQPLRSWLNSYMPNRGLQADSNVIKSSVRHFGSNLRKIFKLANVKLLPNGLRHSCISYYIAAHPDAGIQRVAQWSGNSEQTCKGFYRRILKPEEGEMWFRCLEGV